MARIRKTDKNKASDSTANTSAWFAEAGKEDDIIISTRARLIRNLADFPFSSKILSDKNIIKEDCSAVVINYGDESTSCLVNESDHLKISAFVSGLDCEKVMEKVYKVDEFLQNKLQFAANIDFGYLTSYIKDCGTGLKFTVRLFIPSIVLSGQFESVVEMVRSKKLAIHPVFKSEQIAEQNARFARILPIIILQ